MDRIREVFFLVTTIVALSAVVSMLLGRITLEGFALVNALVSFAALVYFFNVSEHRRELHPADAARIGVVFLGHMQISLGIAAPNWVPEWSEQSYFFSLSMVTAAGLLYWFLEASRIGDRIGVLDSVADMVMRILPQRFVGFFDLRDHRVGQQQTTRRRSELPNGKQDGDRSDAPDRDTPERDRRRGRNRGPR